MDEQIPTFLAVTGVEDESIAKQYLELTNGDLEYAVTLYMEAQPGQLATGSNDDAQFAERLQQEAYTGDNVRDADANIHRHETLVDNYGDSFGFTNQQPSRPQDMFGAGRVGIFNQRFDDEEDDYYRNRIEVLDDDEFPEELEEVNEDDDDEDVIIIDSDDEDADEVNDEPISRRRRNRDSRQAELTSTQRRLANLFRPPFDIIATMNLDTAKLKAKEENKWILINIQDSSEFQSQVLNRDFWSSTRVKQIVRDNFVFLQYQGDSPNGTSYLNFYSTDGFPHIAILDPLTGERVFKWKDGQVPHVETWASDVEDFLTKFSLLPNSNNPMIKHDVKFDPDALSEDQQIEFALKQSIMENKSDDDIIEEGAEPEIVEPLDPFDAIIGADHEEPSSGSITRIQIRFPNGKRIVHKFELSDSILTIYQWLKFLVAQSPDEYGITGEDRFNISNTTNRLFKFLESLEVSVEEANLKNASLLLEKQ